MDNENGTEESQVQDTKDELSLGKALSDLLAQLGGRPRPPDPRYALWSEVATTLAEQRGLIPGGEDHNNSPEHLLKCPTHAYAAEAQKHADAMKAGTSCSCHFCARKLEDWAPETCCAFCKQVIQQVTTVVDEQQEKAARLTAAKSEKILATVDNYMPTGFLEELEQGVTELVAHYNEVAKTEGQPSA